VVDAMETLAAAQRAMVSAERRRAQAARRHREAITARRAAQRARIAALQLATADGTPEAMRRAAEAMGTSTPRVYQLLREYDRRDPSPPADQRTRRAAPRASPRGSGPRKRRGS
jgi:hypothetical protein